MTAGEWTDDAPQQLTECLPAVALAIAKQRRMDAEDPEDMAASILLRSSGEACDHSGPSLDRDKSFDVPLNQDLPDRASSESITIVLPRKFSELAFASEALFGIDSGDRDDLPR